MPESSSFLIVRLQMEKEKLLGWAILAKISDDNEQTADSGFKVDRHTVIDALRQIQILLLDSSQLRRRYKLDLTPAPPDTHHVAGAPTQPTRESRLPLRDDYSALQKSALSFIDKTRKYPRRLQWAAFDKAHFEHLLSDLQGLNDNMMRFLDVYERNRHFQMQEATFMQILQVNNRVQDLFELMQSLKESSADDDDDKRRRAYQDRIIRMTRFKAVSIAIETGNEGADSTVGSSPSPETDAPGSEIPFRHLTNLSAETEERPARSLATCTLTNDDEIQVWIEWRYYQELPLEDSDSESDNDNNHPTPPPFITQRISRLARLLSDREKPTEFLVPESIGYVHDEEHSRFGFVFKSLSPSPESNNYPHHPITLLDLLSSTATHKPSLTIRIRIARMVATSIWYLHATNWLHKGLRSENIVFEGGVDLRSEKPFICGFDYSRPANIGEETERPVENLLYDLYRHPKVQFDVPREGRSGFNKVHDIYSLGVVLYEIAVWKPVMKVLGVDGAGAIKASVAKSVQDRLLGGESIALLESEAGDAVASAVKLCLDGSLVDRRDENMLGPDSNARLQLEFGEKVVSVLNEVSI